MTTKTDAMMGRLDAILAQLETLGITGPPAVPEQHLDAYGNPNYVAAGELIESAWGNSVVDRVINRFPNESTLTGWPAPTGAFAVATDTNRLWLKQAAGWVPYVQLGLKAYAFTIASSGPYSGSAMIPGLSVTFTGSTSRVYRVRVVLPIVEAHLDSARTLQIVDAATNSQVNEGWWFGVDGVRQTMIADHITAGSGAAVTYRAQLFGGNAPASAMVIGGTKLVAHITAEDIGPA